MTEREVAIWSQLGKHRNICQFITARVCEKDIKLSNGMLLPKSDDKYSYVLCEYCNRGTLVNYLMSHSCKLPEPQIVKCML